jgi:DNA invertase Pin-like site-specific DNA recombinase
MSDTTKVTSVHLQRVAVVYIRQSTPGQVEHHRESTMRQYALAERARELGWTSAQVQVIDEDLGVSGSVVSLAKRSGFAHLTTEVALGHVGLVLGLEASPLMRGSFQLETGSMYQLSSTTMRPIRLPASGSISGIAPVAPVAPDL